MGRLGRSPCQGEDTDDRGGIALRTAGWFAREAGIMLKKENKEECVHRTNRKIRIERQLAASPPLPPNGYQPSGALCWSRLMDLEERGKLPMSLDHIRLRCLVSD